MFGAFDAVRLTASASPVSNVTLHPFSNEPKLMCAAIYRDRRG